MVKKKDTNAQNMLGDAGVFRGNKGTVYEGGLRVPFIVRWPGHIQAGVVDSGNVIGRDRLVADNLQPRRREKCAKRSRWG